MQPACVRNGGKLVLVYMTCAWVASGSIRQFWASHALQPAGLQRCYVQPSGHIIHLAACLRLGRQALLDQQLQSYKWCLLIRSQKYAPAGHRKGDLQQQSSQRASTSGPSLLHISAARPPVSLALTLCAVSDTTPGMLAIHVKLF